MREIKFRGKEKCSGLWRCGFLLFDGEKYYIIQTIQGTLVKWIVDTNTIGQFTGLYDKKGEPIYEGDILKVECTDGSSICKLVRFVSEKGAFCMANTFELCHEKRWDIWDCMSQKWINEMEAIVIGNIHDEKNGTS